MKDIEEQLLNIKIPHNLQVKFPKSGHSKTSTVPKVSIFPPASQSTQS